MFAVLGDESIYLYYLHHYWVFKNRYYN